MSVMRSVGRDFIFYKIVSSHQLPSILPFSTLLRRVSARRGMSVASPAGRVVELRSIVRIKKGPVVSAYVVRASLSLSLSSTSRSVRDAVAEIAVTREIPSSKFRAFSCGTASTSASRENATSVGRRNGSESRACNYYNGRPARRYNLIWSFLLVRQHRRWRRRGQRTRQRYQ